MALSMVNASIALFKSAQTNNNATPLPLLPHTQFPMNCPSSKVVSSEGKLFQDMHTRGKRVISHLLGPCYAVESEHIVNLGDDDDDDDDDGEVEEDCGVQEPLETLLYSFSPLPVVLLATLPGAGVVKSLFGPFVELVKSLSLPDWLVHWGHPGNMAVVLFAMGGYGTYLGFQIRSSEDVEVKAKAKDLHPKLMAGMFFFFALGATGGVTSLLTSDRPIFESPHAVTGIIGLSLLTIQTILPSLFEGRPGLRNVHGILGSGIMTLFLVHAALGLQLGLSY